MKCEVCGLQYGVSHNCPGPLAPAAQELLAADLHVPGNAGMGYYLGQAVKIVRWDDLAIRRNAKDQRATLYGVLFWITAALILLLGTTVPAMLRSMPKANPAVLLIGMIFGMAVGLLLLAVITFVQLGLCHLVAKWFFGATGKFVQVMRPLLLGWFVNCLALIPVAGMLLAGIGWTAVLMMVFEEVDEIERLQAFGISAGINVCFLILQIALLPGGHL